MFLISTSNYNPLLKEFNNNWDCYFEYLQKNQIDGIELMLYNDHDLDRINKSYVKGVHLFYYPTWINKTASEKQKMIDLYKRQLDIAHSLEVEYMVFHVSHVLPEETFTKKYKSNSKEVLSHSIELINKIFNQNYSIKVLFENLWWPGLNFLEYPLTKFFIDQVEYSSKGFMLDLSHLLITNSAVNNLEIGTEYILKKIKALQSVQQYIKGVHINKSLSGGYLNQAHDKKLKEYLKAENREAAFEILHKHISTIDPHLPYDHLGINRIFDEVCPKYKVFEFKIESRDELSKVIKKQFKYIK